MTQAPPPYGGYPPYAAPPRPPAKPRPSGWWFVVGGTLLAVALAVFVASIAWLVIGVVRTDARIPVDGQSHRVMVDTGGDRVIWRDGSYFQPTTCQVTDVQTGSDIPLSPVTGAFTKNLGSGEWIATWRFDPGSGRLDVRCSATGTPQDIEIGPAPDVQKIFALVVLGMLVPGLLGLLGLVVIVVTGVLWATRPPRPSA